jgi:hypothetical protein
MQHPEARELKPVDYRVGKSSCQSRALGDAMSGPAAVVWMCDTVRRPRGDAWTIRSWRDPSWCHEIRGGENTLLGVMPLCGRRTLEDESKI